jgi:hypothetical protein
MKASNIKSEIVPGIQLDKNNKPYLNVKTSGIFTINGVRSIRSVVTRLTAPLSKLKELNIALKYTDVPVDLGNISMIHEESPIRIIRN